MEKLLLYNNRLKGCPARIASFVNLSVLDLSNNLVGALPEGLAHMSNLTQLFLRNNLIGDGDLPKSLSSLRKLRDLNLSGNRLTSFPPQILEVYTATAVQDTLAPQLMRDEKGFSLSPSLLGRQLAKPVHGSEPH